jgi:hypothetical protein
MTDQPVIKLHNSKETEFEFNVAIQGPSEEAKPVVRFVLENIKGYNVAIDCEQAGDDSWAVKIPALNILEENHNFHVEVIVDGYFFVPTSGLIEVVNPPQVAIKESIATSTQDKPKVVAKFESTIVATPKKRLVEYYDLKDSDQDALHKRTKQAGVLLQKAGKMMEQGFDAKSTKPLDTSTLDKMLTIVKESVDSLKSKIFM